MNKPYIVHLDIDSNNNHSITYSNEPLMSPVNNRIQSVVVTTYNNFINTCLEDDDDRTLIVTYRYTDTYSTDTSKEYLLEYVYELPYDRHMTIDQLYKDIQVRTKFKNMNILKWFHNTTVNEYFIELRRDCISHYHIKSVEFNGNILKSRFFGMNSSRIILDASNDHVVVSLKNNTRVRVYNALTIVSRITLMNTNTGVNQVLITETDVSTYDKLDDKYSIVSIKDFNEDSNEVLLEYFNEFSIEFLDKDTNQVLDKGCYCPITGVDIVTTNTIVSPINSSLKTRIRITIPNTLTLIKRDFNVVCYGEHDEPLYEFNYELPSRDSYMSIEELYYNISNKCCIPHLEYPDVTNPVILIRYDQYSHQCHIYSYEHVLRDYNIKYIIIKGGIVSSYLMGFNKDCIKISIDNLDEYSYYEPRQYPIDFLLMDDEYINGRLLLNSYMNINTWTVDDVYLIILNNTSNKSCQVLMNTEFK